MLICRTLDRDVKGSIFTGAVLCPLPLIVLVNTQKSNGPVPLRL